jgi:16S rRNA (adenine1518-N6/adenine1519-N6)-dimethyltransferase
VNTVRPKKGLGQHFLTDKNIARNIVGSLSFENYNQVLEIGPGMGVLTGLLLEIGSIQTRFVEIDPSSVEYLNTHFAGIHDKIITADALELDFNTIFPAPYAVIGNFPYNISSQLFFRILAAKQQVAEVVCMLQKEVAARIASPPGSREYGILSVFIQAYYRIEYLFTVPPQVFNPPPKVQSAVIRLKRNDRLHLPCNEALFATVVKTAFNQRRKMLRNSIKNLLPEDCQHPLLHLRPEQLGVDEFINLTQLADTRYPESVF